jgi:hypothetical protein
MPGIETALKYDIGTDQAYDFTVYTSDAKTVCRDITGWAMSFMVKRKATDADGSALVTKTTGAGIVISGSFDSDPSANTQVARVTINDTDADGSLPDTTAVPAGIYRHELKRTDAGSEARAAYGTIAFNQTVHRT